MISWFVFLTALYCLALVYLLYKVILLATADADLTLYTKKIKPSYFNQKVVWVTGASSGIGEELCYQLSRLGARLILTSRSEEKLKLVRKGLAKPHEAKILPVDLSDPVATRAATEKARELFGQIDILVNNAGVSTRRVLLTDPEMQESTHRKVMEIDLFAPWILTHDVLPGMLSSGFGHVVSVSSASGKASSAYRTTYSAAKFALNGMMDALRLELVDKNVYVTTVCPGPVRTRVMQNAFLKDGSTIDKTDPEIERGMTVKRCAQLTLAAISNQLSEVWIAKQPHLLFFYFAQYTPTLCEYLLRKRAQRYLAKTEKKHLKPVSEQ